MKELSPRRKRILRGESKHKLATRLALIKTWEAEGFNVRGVARELEFQVTNFEQQGACNTVFVTSLSPTRIRRQLTCLRTWEKFGVTIKALQSAAEIEELSRLFPAVEFIETSDLIGKHVRVRRLAAEAKDQPVIVLNADLELYGPQAAFLEDWDRPGFHLGIRWNYTQISHCIQEEWGVDALLIQPNMVESLQDDELGALGLPGWDWGVPKLLELRGFEQSISNAPQFFHQKHHQTWTREQSLKAQSAYCDQFGFTIPDMQECVRRGRQGGEARVAV